MFKQNDLIYLSLNNEINQPRIVKKVVEAFVKLTIGDIIGNTKDNLLFENTYELISHRVYGLSKEAFADTTYLELVFLMNDFIAERPNDDVNALIEFQRLTYKLVAMIHRSSHPICVMLRSVSVQALFNYLNGIHSGAIAVSMDEYLQISLDLFYQFVDATPRSITLKSLINQLISMSNLYLVPWDDFSKLEDMAIDIFRVYKVLFFEFFCYSMYNRWDGRKYMHKNGIKCFDVRYPARRKKAV